MKTWEQYIKTQNENHGGVTNKMLNKNPNALYVTVPDQYEKDGNRVIGCPYCQSEFVVPLWMDNKNFYCPKCRAPLPNLPLKQKSNLSQESTN